MATHPLTLNLQESLLLDDLQHLPVPNVKRCEKASFKIICALRWLLRTLFFPKIERMSINRFTG